MKEKYRNSDVELRNSLSGNDGNEESKNNFKTKSSNLRALLIGGIVFCGAVFIAIILSYFLVYDTVETQVESVSKTCSDSDPAVRSLKNPPKQLVRLYPFNISNPYEYVNGATAKIYELGLYAIDLQPNRKNLDLSKSSGTISFDLWNDVEFNPSKSCPECDQDDLVNVPNVAFLTLLSQVQNEGALLLQATCTPTQIALIQKPTAGVPYCNSTQRGKPVNCVCCSPVPKVDATTCKDLTTQKSKPGGLVSYLAKYDNGLQLNNVASDFLLSTGAYTPLVRSMTVREVAFGTVSAYAGLFRTAGAYKSNDWSTVYENGNTTIDVRDACLLACPSVDSVVAQVSTKGLNAFKEVECVGYVPSPDVLVANTNLTQDRANQLRYLEGVNCRPFGVAIAIAAVLKVTGSGVRNVCSDGSSTLPCCLLSSTSTIVTASGIGCLTWVGGLIQPKRVYSVDDAIANLKPSPATKFYSGCAEGANKFQQIIWKGVSQYDEWFTPSTYVYPNMPWAEPSIMRKGKVGVISGNMTIFQIGGFQVSLREGRGITSNFLEYDFTDGKPKYTEEEIWSPFKLRKLNITYQKKSEVQGIQTNRFLSNIPNLTTDAELEASQRRGEMPYPNVDNLVYALDGSPVIMSLPIWYGSDSKILYQSSNMDRKSSSTVGVNLYRTRSSYSKNADVLSSPELVTQETWDTFGETTYRSKVEIEPATGLTLTGKIANQFSVFTWNCNPASDSSCGLQGAPYNSADPLCYISGGVQYPCNAANIFTPKVMGGKVLPIYILNTDPDIPDNLVKSLQSGLSIRYSLSILVIILPILAIGIGSFLGYRLYHLIQEEEAAHKAGATSHDAVLSTSYGGDALVK